MVLKVKNWEKFQHFKDRTPPWIKLYREILDDPDFHELSGDDAKVLMMIWLIASEDDTKQGCLPSVKKMAFRMRISEDKLNQSLTNLSHWLIQSDISVISDRYQDDAPETETEERQRRGRTTYNWLIKYGVEPEKARECVSAWLEEFPLQAFELANDEVVGAIDIKSPAVFFLSVLRAKKAALKPRKLKVAL